MPVFVADEQDAVQVDADNLRRLADTVLADQRVPGAMEVSVLFVDRATIAALNAQHMGHDGPTDVLAFPVDLPGNATGELDVIARVVAPEELAGGRWEGVLGGGLTTLSAGPPHTRALWSPQPPVARR